MKDWKEGKLNTLGGAETELQSRIIARLEMEGVELLGSEVSAWLEDLNPKLEQLTAEVCAKYGIPMKGLTFDVHVEPL